MAAEKRDSNLKLGYGKREDIIHLHFTKA